MKKIICGALHTSLNEKKVLKISHLLGGKDVSLVVTVSVMTRKRQRKDEILRNALKFLYFGKVLHLS